MSEFEILKHLLANDYVKAFFKMRLRGYSNRYRAKVFRLFKTVGRFSNRLRGFELCIAKKGVFSEVIDTLILVR